MRVVALMLFSFTFISCGHGPTKYGPYSKQGGYIDSKDSYGAYVTRFYGNTKTQIGHTKTYSILRAIEVCRMEGYKIADILNTTNISTSKDVVESSSYTYQQPTYYSGSSSTTGNYSGYGNTGYLNSNTNTRSVASGGTVISKGSSWIKTYTYPGYEILYVCRNSKFVAGIEIESVNEPFINNLIKDTLSVIQVSSVMSTSPNLGILSKGDMIYKVNGKRVSSNAEFLDLIHISNNKNKIRLSVIKEGRKQRVFIKTKDITMEVFSWQEEGLRKACDIQSDLSPCNLRRNLASQ